jgi:hypothetical protein
MDTGRSNVGDVSFKEVTLRTKDDYSEGLSNHLLTFLPERRGSGGIERISTYAFANGADADVVWYDPPDVAVLAVLTADRVSGRDNACPD